MPARNELAAGGLLLASAVAFGAFMGHVARGGLRVDDYTDAQLGADPFKEWTAAVIAFGLTGLAMDAWGRWVLHYAATGEMLSAEQVVSHYE